MRQLEAYGELTDETDEVPALMDCYRALGRPKKLADAWANLRQRSPEPEVLAEARIVVAGALADRGDLDGAIELLVAAGAARALRNPSDRHVRQWYALADLYERAGDLPKARDLFVRVLQAEPDAYDVTDRLAALGPERPRRNRRRPAAPDVDEATAAVGAVDETTRPLTMPIKINDRTLIEALWGEDSYALLFVLLLIDYVMMSLVNSAQWGGLLRTAPVVLTVLFAMHTSHAAPARAPRRPGRGGVRDRRGDRAGDRPVHDPSGRRQRHRPGSVVPRDGRAPARHAGGDAPADPAEERVDIETLFAAVDVYIIIGLIFSALFTGLAYVHTHPPFLAQPPSSPHQPSDYVYLSFVTLTTVGFGDLTPLTDLARSVVVFEALIGQIFLVTLVARLVSLYSRENQPGRYLTREPRHRGTDDDDDGGTGRHRWTSHSGHRRRTPDDLVDDPDSPDPAAPDLEREPDDPDAPDRDVDAPADGSPPHEGPGADRG